MNYKLSTLEREKEDMYTEKKYCLDLLVKNTEKNEIFDNENRAMRSTLQEYNNKCRALEL